jgi:hypothetical protein
VATVQTVTVHQALERQIQAVVVVVVANLELVIQHRLVALVS